MNAYLDWIREKITENIPDDYYEDYETSTPENYESYARDNPFGYESSATDNPYDYLSKHYCEAILNPVRRRRRMCRRGGRRQSQAELNRKQLEA